jgi:hemoglobin
MDASGAEARAADPRRVGAGVAVGVDEAMIHAVVHAFYDRVRRDPLLAPIFARIADDSWSAHLDKLCDFWSSVMLMTGRFKGRPMQVHAAMAGISPAHFTRWLALFGETAREVCPPSAAALFEAKAAVIAESLQLGIAFSRKTPPITSGDAAPPLPNRG